MHPGRGRCRRRRAVIMPDCRALAGGSGGGVDGASFLMAQRMMSVTMAMVVVAGVSMGVGLAGGGLVGGGLVSSARGTGAVAPSPAVIGVVNMEKVFADLAERAAKQAELEAAGGAMQTELNNGLKEGQDLESQVQAKPDGPEKRAMTERLAEMQVNLRVKKELFEARLDKRRADMFRELYAKINDASKRLASSNGYGMILASDEGVQIPAGASAQEVQRIISLRRMLHTAPTVDVTAELVTMMNNEFAARGNAPGSK